MKYRISNLILESYQLEEMVTLEVLKKLRENAETITKEQAKQFIENAGSKIFTVVFIKKDGTERVMNCMQGVKKHLTGGSLRYDPKEKGLVSVFDMQSKGYRMIVLDTITTLKINGKVYNVA